MTDLEDSPDLTLDEAVLAHPVGDPKELAAHLGLLRCSVCGAVTVARKHSHRRLAPHSYWRVDLRCEEGHDVRQTYRLDWSTS